MNNKKLKILIPIYSFGRTGGIRVLSQLSNNWVTDGHCVEFVVFKESEKPYFPVNAKVTWIDEKGDQTVNEFAEVRLRNTGLKRMRALYKYLNKNANKYDIVLANYNLTAWPVWLGSKSKNFYYIQAYEPYFFSQNKRIKSLIQRFLAWMTYFLPLTHVVNSYDYEKYNIINSDKVVFPGLDLSTYYPKRIVKKDMDDQFVVGCIGRKESWKGSNYIGEAIKILHDEGYKNIKLRVAFNSLEYKNHELVIPDGDENLAQYYRGLDVLVATGLRKNNAIHYPVIEGMACKTPVITTGYYPSNNNNSFLVPPKRPDIIAETIKSIMNDYYSAIEKAERAYVDVKQFNWQDISEKFIKIFYDEIEGTKYD